MELSRPICLLNRSKTRTGPKPLQNFHGLLNNLKNIFFKDETVMVDYSNLHEP